MVPIPRHLLVRRGSIAHGRYAIIFAVLASFIILGGILWGCFVPKWRRRHQKPARTRHNGWRTTQNAQTESKHDFELPVMFPPHPAVIIPVDGKRTLDDHSSDHNLSPILVYDPRTQSPFPYIPGIGSCLPLTLEIPKRRTSKPANLHAARLQHSALYKSSHSPRGHGLSNIPSSRTRNLKAGQIQPKSIRYGRSALFVARSAGAPPPRKKPAAPALKKSQHQLATLKDLDNLPASGSSATRAADEMAGPRPDIGYQIEELFVSKPLQTPGQARYDARNIFETPSSPETVATSHFGTSPNHLHLNSTPLTGPSSVAVQNGGNGSAYPGISKLVPSRRFEKYSSTHRSKYSPFEESASAPNLFVSAEHASGSYRVMGIRHRPKSAPSTSSRHDAKIDLEIAGDLVLPELDAIANIQLHRIFASDSPSSSVESAELLPRPLTFRRTMTSQSPLLSPTPLGRYVSNGSSSEISMRRNWKGTRPVTRGKSPSLKRCIQISPVFKYPGKFPAKVATNGGTADRKLEQNPFLDRLGLARVGGNKRRSSVASLSTLKIPKSFRSSDSRAGSSIYSRNTKGMSVPPSPGLASDVPTSLQSLPEQSPTRRAISVDETCSKGFDWTLPFADDIDVPSRHDRSASLKLKEACRPNSKMNDSRTPSGLTGQSTADTATPDVGIASSNTFGTKMPVPKISIARSSDDVFRARSPMASQRPAKGPAAGIDRSFKSVRAMGSKLSYEDLVRYGGRTAPGGAEWF